MRWNASVLLGARRSPKSSLVQNLDTAAETEEGTEERLELPSGDAESVDHADWVEVTTLFRDDGSTSREDVARALKRPGLVAENRARLLATLR